MKALVYLGPGRKRIEERPKPAIKAPGDAIVKISKTTICGTDLHILKGDVATCVPGRILGQEGTGVIDSVGAFSNLFRYWRRTTGRLQFAGSASPTKSPAPKEAKKSAKLDNAAHGRDACER